MRSYRYLIVSLVLVLFFHTTAALRYPLVPRQNDSPSSERSRIAESTQIDTSSSPSSIAPSAKPSTTRTQSQSPSPATSDHVTTPPNSVTGTIQAPVTAPSNDPLTPTSAKADSENSLPIHPKITPAIGLTGVILLISGLIYAVIGIKNKWLYVSLSAAYLTALAVTVLIVYLMTPPVSNAVQGGFFVAAVLSGLIFGALSLVFTDITDGLGCLLGGFCLSMWFLTLKKNGLITSTAGRAIFIACMSVGGYSLSFSHYTRTYGLIVCISFAGATIAILGIDCFSCAGLKEFWLYLWNLNADTFPLNTNTYPMTRGIRVELAGIVIFCVFGIMSQLKLWKLVKERREKSAVQRLEREQHQAHEEEALGRKIEDDISRERAQWEATYGDKQLAKDSVHEVSSGSNSKTSTSTRGPEDSESASVEMVALSPQTKGLQDDITPARTSVTVVVLPNEDGFQEIDEEERPIRAKVGGLLERSNAPGMANGSEPPSPELLQSNEMPRSASARSSVRSSMPSPPPAIVPLPFSIPKDEDAQSVEMDNSSLSAVHESVHGDTLPVPPRFSKRFSGSSALKRASKASSPDGEEQVLIVPHIDDDRASSVAATLDDDFNDFSLPALSRTSSPIVFAIEPAGDVSSLNNHVPSRLSLNTNIEAKSPVTRQSRSSSISLGHQTDTLISDREEESKNSQLPKSAKSGAPSVSSRTESQVGLSKDILPEKLSRVAQSYRTNEWAKHLEVAEEPDMDELDELESPGVKLVNDDERPAPVSDELRGIKSPPTTKMNLKKESSGTVPVRNSTLVRPSLKMPNVSQARVSSRISSIPQGMVSSAHARDLAAARLEGNASPPQKNTLMDKREALVRDRVHSYTARPLSPNATPDPDQDNMTLAQRKQLMKLQKPPPAAQKRRHSNQVGVSTQNFNSHPPKRSSNAIDPNRREVMLANWRESMKQEAGPTQPKVSAEEAYRARLMDERRQKELEKQQRDMAKQQRESTMDSMMRSGGMLDAHREAMRKMQARASRNVS